MDANGLRFWMLADEGHWRPRAGADYDPRTRRLRLRSGRTRRLPDAANEPGAEVEARGALRRVPQAHDRFGSRAFWDAARRAIGASSPGVPALRRAARLWPPAGADAPAGMGPGEPGPDDLALGHDGILYVASGGSVILHDPRHRWADAVLSAPGFRAWRLAPDPGGGAWVLDHDGQRLAHVHGAPLPDRPFAPYTACTARPCVENPDPPALVVLPELRWPGSEAVAIACAPDGRLGLLAWRPGEDARLYLQRASDDGAGPASRPALDIVVTLAGARFPYTLAWVSDAAVATRVTRLPGEALVYEIEDALGSGAAQASFSPSGDVYPLRDAAEGPFAHTLELPPRYPAVRPAGDDPSEPAEPTVPLHRLSAPAYRRRGRAVARRPVDGGSTDTVWHRLYLEALLPPGCGVRVLLAATDERVAPAGAAAWHEHHFGDVPPRVGTPGYAVPRGAWVRTPSEIPFHDGFLGDCAADAPAGRAGLFTALVQRATRPVRSLRGRYLWVRVELTGDRRATPEIAALRVYGSRFSYVERYLPALYRERLLGAERDDVLPAGAPSTPADFLERFVGNFEGVLTPLEDRIGSAWLLTDPRATPDASLEWLAGWVGVAFDAGYPADRRRELLRAAPHLFRRRGTAAGLADALGIATGGRLEGGRVAGGAVERGDVVVLENWRLRRTMATILGADLADEEDPLLAGIVASGNSFVGDTLVLGDEHRAEFLALFAPEAAQSRAERDAVAALFERLAHRVTVLVRQEVAAAEVGLIRRVVELEKPAHVEALVATARYPFLVSVASLVGVDTYLRAPEPPRPVDVGRSLIGVRDLLLEPPTLDPRLGGASTRLLGATPPSRPTAVLRGPSAVPFAESFELDGSASRPAEGRQITRYSWRMLV